MHLKATVMNTGTEVVLLEYFAGQLFEVVIRDESGTIVYVHSDRGIPEVPHDGTVTSQACARGEPHKNHGDTAGLHQGS